MNKNKEISRKVNKDLNKWQERIKDKFFKMSKDGATLNHSHSNLKSLWSKVRAEQAIFLCEWFL